MAKKTFDREQWAADAKVRVEKAKAALEAGLNALQTSDDWKRTLAAMAALGPARLGRLSFRNAMLVLMARPDARHVATFNTWRKLGRSVSKGSKALTILQPRFAKYDEDDDPQSAGQGRSGQPNAKPAGTPATPAGTRSVPNRASKVGSVPNRASKVVGFSPLSVFALEQTDGPALPGPRPEKDLQTPEGFAWGVEQLKAVAEALPEVDGIELRKRAPSDHPSARGSRTKRIVVVTGEASDAMNFRVLVHEVAHALLHPQGDHHSTPEREVEAESTAFVVCHALGFDTGDVSFPYVAEWAHGTDALKLLASTGQRILSAATKLLEVLAPEQTEAEPAAEGVVGQAA